MEFYKLNWYFTTDQIGLLVFTLFCIRKVNWNDAMELLQNFEKPVKPRTAVSFDLKTSVYFQNLLFFPHLQLLIGCFLFAPGTFHPSFHAVFLDMIRDLLSLNLLTASCNTIHQGVLATGHVILEGERVMQLERDTQQTRTAENTM